MDKPKNKFLPDINDPYFKRLNTFLKTSGSESERGRVLVSSSLIEEMLDEILKAYMADCKATNKLFDEGNAPLGTLSAKSALARALWFINEEEFSDIEMMRKIRNAFAHNVLCSFEQQQIRDWSKNLRVGMARLDELEPGHKSRVDDPSARFSMVATALVSILYNRAHYVANNKVNEVSWPG